MKWKKTYNKALLRLVVVYGGFGAMIYISRMTSGRYIVLDKKDKQIWYSPLTDSSDVHIMTFQSDTLGPSLYDDLRIGDTITGGIGHFKDSVVSATTFRVCPRLEYYVIQTVNNRRVTKFPVGMRIDEPKQKQR